MGSLRVVAPGYAPPGRVGSHGTLVLIDGVNTTGQLADKKPDRETDEDSNWIVFVLRTPRLGQCDRYGDVTVLVRRTSRH
jgi:hypothetical protein